MLKNIVIIYDDATITGGAGKIAITSAIELAKRGFNVFFFCGTSLHLKELTDASVKIVSFDGSSIGSNHGFSSLLHAIVNKNAGKSLSKLLKTLSPEETIVHIHGWCKSLSSYIFKVVSKEGFKSIITAHDYFIVCPNGGLFNYKKCEICKKKPSSLSCYLSNCDKKNFLVKIYRDVRQHYLKKNLKKYNGSILYVTKNSQKHIEELLPFTPKHYYQLDNFVEMSTEQVTSWKNNVFLFIGRLSPEKGIDVFCEAVQEAQVKGVVVGDGELLNPFQTKYPNITFSGWLNPVEVKNQYQKTRVLIVTSKWYETMGLTVVEALSNGIPCIVPKHCIASDFILDGENGFLYDIDDLESLKEKIALLRDDLLVKEMGEKAFKTLNRENFSYDNHFTKLIEIYNKEME